MGSRGILFVATTDLSVPTASGIHVSNIARAFRAMGKDVDLIAKRSLADDKKIEKSGVIFRRFYNSDNRVFLNILAPLFQFILWMPVLRKKKYEFIYIRASSSSFFLTVLARIFLKGTIVTEHNGWIADEARVLGMSPVISWLQSHLQYWEARLSDHNRVVTVGLQRVLVEHGVPMKKVHVIGNGTDTAQFTPISKSVACEIFGLDNSRPTVGFIGNIVPWQGCDRFLDALPELLKRQPDMLALIAGGGAQLDQVKTRVAEMKLDNSVRVLGWIPYDLANAFICCCDVAVAPFISERNERIGLSPLKIRDYASAGRAIVSSDLPGISELAKENILVTCDTQAPLTFAREIASLLDADDRRQALGERARAYAEANFDWSVIARQIHGIATEKGKQRQLITVHVLGDTGDEQRLVAYLTGHDKRQSNHVVITLGPRKQLSAQLFRCGIPVIELGKDATVSLGALLRMRRVLKALDADIIDYWSSAALCLGHFAERLAFGRKKAKALYHKPAQEGDGPAHSLLTKTLIEHALRGVNCVIYQSGEEMVPGAKTLPGGASPMSPVKWVLSENHPKAAREQLDRLYQL